MRLNDIPNKAIEKVIKDYDDAEYKHEFIKRYNYQNSKVWFLVVNGKDYPPKAIVGIAHKREFPNEPIDDMISHRARDFLRSRNYVVEYRGNDESILLAEAAEQTQNKNSKKSSGRIEWADEENILAMEFYMLFDGLNSKTVPSLGSIEIQNLADDMHNIIQSLNLRKNKNFRDVGSLRMKLQNFQWIDTQGEEGLSNPGARAKEIWEQYKNDWEGLKKIADSIRQQAKNKIDESTTNYDGTVIEEYTEGNSVTIYQHKRRERSRKLVIDKKKKFMEMHGKLFCEACNFNFGEVYGERGNGFIECHHIKPVSQMKENEKTNLDDLALVCANCHRMIHTEQPWLTMNELKLILTGK